MDSFDKTVQKAKDVFDIAVNKTGEFVNVSKLKISVANLNNKLEKAYAELGKVQFKVLKDSNLENPQTSAAVFEIKRIINEIKDLLEEIVGEIRDEYDGDEAELIKEIDDNIYLVEGSMKLDDINDAIDTNFDSEDYDSIGGLIIESLDRLPEDKESVILENGTILQVEGISQNRITKVLITLPVDEDDDADEDSEDKIEISEEINEK